MKKYWRSLEEWNRGPETPAFRPAEDEHKNAVLSLMEDEKPGGKASRRDFLKLVGFSFTTAALASSCEKPVHKAIPYLIKPEEVTPGKASYYATHFYDGSEYCPVVTKVRDGRPIKIEANKHASGAGGGTSARVQASVLGLYDEARYKEPAAGSGSISWDELDTRVKKALDKAGGGRQVLLTSTVISPSTRTLINNLQDRYPRLEWITYDELSASGLREAHRRLTGEAVIPGYHFHKARLIVSFDADFLGTWLAPVEFAAGYARGRGVSKENPYMSRHVQVESVFSLTGTNADERIPVTPDENRAILAKIYNDIARIKGAPPIQANPCSYDTSGLSEALLDHQGSSLVVNGSNDPDIQQLTAMLNELLGNYGKTLDLAHTLQLKQGDDRRFEDLAGALTSGEVETMLIYNANPVYSWPGGDQLAEVLEDMPLSVYIGSAINETGKACTHVAPDHHFLEAWGDAQPVTGTFSIQQPTIHPLYNTRAFQDSLLAWTGQQTGYYHYLKTFWEDRIYPASGADEPFTDWWNSKLQAGVFRDNQTRTPLSVSVPQPGFSIVEQAHGGYSLHLYAPVGVNDGRHANNPWLQELPDPVSKVCWDNYLAVSVTDAEEMGVATEDVVMLAGEEVPVLVQPGQAKGTIALALGYGRKTAGKVAEEVGVNGFRWVTRNGPYRSCEHHGLTPEKTVKTYELALTQTHHNMEERPIVRETTLEDYQSDPYAGNHFHVETEKHHQTLYPETDFDGFHWGLVVDLNKCIACNNCVVSCIAENNIATVGKQEVRNRRILHWMRIDRYYSDDPEQPDVLHQPVMCQHCDNAPCENVCPVSATLHSNEGLNQVAYVRCIGTKYCINNCPYRVRRFNWFKYVNNEKFNYHLNNQTTKMVLNPDVTVRSRGVVEKCSFCVQRIQEKKLEAKLENRKLRDGEIQPACVQSCPTGALVFGDLNNPESRVSKLMKEERNYHLLEQLHTLPSVGYLTRVRNRKAGSSQESDQTREEDHS